MLQSLQNADPEQEPSQWAPCTGEHVKVRNRYVNVEPYGSNRVRLHVPEGQNDYINASSVVLQSTRSDKVLTYIATQVRLAIALLRRKGLNNHQGPKHDTYPHFWRMVWHETTTPAVIVMLTQTYESSREKCFPYYPESLDAPSMRLNAQNEYEDGFIHNLSLTSLENQDEVRAEVRELDMTTEDGSESRKIWHLLFAGWPDFLVPQGADREALIRLIAMSREKNADNATNPRIVHCSAGVGRSGTFIALDWLLQELDDGSLDEVQDNEDPIFGVVSNMRDQRMMMVQSEPQLVFIYELLREKWRDRWIAQHPEDAENLGVGRKLSEAPEGSPRLKRQKSTKQTDGDEDASAALEAELSDADIDSDKGDS